MKLILKILGWWLAGAAMAAVICLGTYVFAAFATWSLPALPFPMDADIARGFAVVSAIFGASLFLKWKEYNR